MLSAEGFAAIRSVGFEPVGQVFGAVVFPLASTAAVSCPGTTMAFLVPAAPGVVTGVPDPATRIARALDHGRRTAIARMTGECSDLGGHGIVGTSLQVIETGGDSSTGATVTLTALGTAVRATGCPPLARPFTTDLSGHDFAKLLAHGWMPAGIALATAAAGLHDPTVTTSSGPWQNQNGEMPGYTDLVMTVRRYARTRLEDAVLGLGADGVVVSALTLRVRSEPCRAHPPGTDHFAEAVITGTAVACFDRRRAARGPSLTILPLNDGRPDR